MWVLSEDVEPRSDGNLSGAMVLTVTFHVTRDPQCPAFPMDPSCLNADRPSSAIRARSGVRNRAGARVVRFLLSRADRTTPSAVDTRWHLTYPVSQSENKFQMR